jgi:D-alanyl-D-alanine carboxypeptidase/D-alanyl-D-alanine-endopeptidase (penicillin-binding protein 4)
MSHGRAAALLFALLTIVTLTPSARADLQSDVRAVLREKYLAKATVGISIARLSGGQPELLFAHNATRPLIPASNLKLVTTAAAIDQLGADFRFRTALLLKDNQLYLVGDGDPTLGDVEMLRKVGWGVDTVFKMWAEELKKRNITSVDALHVDDSVFDEQFLHPNWPADQEERRYVAGVGGVNLNANCIDFYVRRSRFGQPVDFSTEPSTGYVTIRNTCVTGNEDAIGLHRARGANDILLRGETDISRTAPLSITIEDPPMFAATVLSETLAESGVSVGSGPVRTRIARAAFAREGEAGGWKIIAVLDTQLVSVLGRANKDSMNLYAEALCKRIGHAVTGEPGSWTNGTAAIGAFLERCGVSAEQFHLDDGCGLSKENGISAEAIVKVLAREHAGKNAELFRNSLAVAGVDGTFEYRFRNSDLRGRVYGKSGYVNAVSSISGYVNARDGNWYAFSILMNELPYRTNNTAKELQERIVEAIDDNVETTASAQ